jgi:hypothetical protein
MKKYICVPFALLAASMAYADGEITKAGTMRIDGGAERSSTLHIACSSDRDGGALYFEITVPEANTKKDFGYDDFEGPDAKPGALSNVEWIVEKRTTKITSTAAGSYTVEPAEGFRFEIAELSRRKSAPATLLAGADGSAAKLVWTQSSYDKSRRTLVATFAFDAGESARVRDTVKACLPK